MGNAADIVYTRAPGYDWLDEVLDDRIKGSDKGQFPKKKIPAQQKVVICSIQILLLMFKKTAKKLFGPSHRIG